MGGLRLSSTELIDIDPEVDIYCLRGRTRGHRSQGLRMIVRATGNDLFLITQPDHAELAAALMREWKGHEFASRPTREAALFATARHDIGWAEEDRAARLDRDTGRPFDFMTLPDRRRQAIWPRAIDALSTESTYAAALVAQHALTIYRRNRVDPEWAAFFATLEAERDRWFDSAARPEGLHRGVDPPAGTRTSFLQDYAMLRMGDLLSLSYCNAWSSPEELEGFAIWSDGERLSVSPDPFEGAEVSIAIAARRLPEGPYRSEHELEEAWASAPIVRLEGVARGVPPLEAS
jgi:hypothetical protein